MANQKNNIDILEEIREFRNNQLKELGDNRVFYTTAISLEKGETGQQIYRIMEEYSIGENESLVRELFYKYEENPELIAVIDPEKFEDEQIHKPDGIEPTTEEEKANWKFLVKDIEEGRIKEQEKIREQALNLGISQKEIEGLAEIDIDKKVFSKINEINKQNEDNKDKRTGNNTENRDEEVPFNISKQNAQRLGIVGMNTMPLNQKVGIHGENLKEELGLADKEQYADVDTIEIIPTYKLAALGVKVPDTPFVAVARHKDGSIESFPKDVCEIYKGENNRITNIDGQKDEATTEKADTIMHFKGNKENKEKNVSIAINQKSPYGIVEASLAYNTRDNDGRVGITLQDKYDGTDQNDFDARKIVDPHKGTEHLREVAKEGKRHPEGEKNEREDADGNTNTAAHLHLESIVDYEGREANFKILAMTIGGCSNEEEVNDLLERTNSKLGEDNSDVEQAINQAIKERNNIIISQAQEPEKVKELMERASINNPNDAINILNANNGDAEKAVEQCEEQYRNENEKF